MIQSKKEEATRFQEVNRVDKEARPVYHVTPPTGWMNDPNGFSIYKDKIHLFYQYHPYKDIWGPMHWGHCTSADFISWDDLPVALAPDEDYDASGCFSGSAIDVNGEQILIYTGAAKRAPGTSTKLAIQQQCLAAGDGTDYVKSEHNPVIPTDMLPAGYHANHFRDPKVWEYDKAYWVVTVAMDENEHGHVLMYTSDDLMTWHYVSDVLASDGKYGGMWECPDLFKLDGQDVLIVSCMHMKDSGPGYHDGYGVISCIGRMDWESGKLLDPVYRPLDQGGDFYAPQTIEMADGRRIMIAWMQAWENFIKPVDQKWHGMMTFPRELRLRDGKLVQAPVRELERAWVNPLQIKDVVIAGGTAVEVPGLAGRALDMTVEVTKADCKTLTIGFAESEETGVTFVWSPEKKTIVCERKLWGVQHHVTDTYANQEIVLPDGDAPKLRFLVDTASVELFINDGEETFSITYYAPMDQRSIRFKTDGSATLSIQKYDIDPRAAMNAPERTDA